MFAELRKKWIGTARERCINKTILKEIILVLNSTQNRFKFIKK